MDGEEAMSAPQRELFLDVIFRTFGHSRFTQDSPLRPDVWMELWKALMRGQKNPRVDLILTPATPCPAGQLAVALEALLAHAPGPLEDTAKLRLKQRKQCRISYTRTTVQAELALSDVLYAAVALSDWWEKREKESRDKDRETRDTDSTRPGGARALAELVSFLASDPDPLMTVDRAIQINGASFQFYRFVALASLSLLLRDRAEEAEPVARQLRDGKAPLRELLSRLREPLHEALTGIDSASETLRAFEAANGMKPRLFSATVNRAASNAVYKSRKTIKVDATHYLFKVDTRDIRWAVIDSGVDARHPAFLQPKSEGAKWSDRTRIVSTYDLTFLRELLTLADYPAAPPGQAAQGAGGTDAAWTAFVTEKRSTEARTLKQLIGLRDAGLAIGWDVLSRLVQIPHDDAFYRPPRNEHGTHVAGILAANWAEDPPCFPDSPEVMVGTCPELQICDIRAFDAEGRGHEDTVIEALDLVRFLNGESSRPVIHGVNMSLSVGHDVKAFGCGQSPVCVACNDLVRSGVVVVAAAGNAGHEGDPSLRSFGQDTRDISITDPGNAELVITVGSTHRDAPHRYGVSYFSSRGPTADGRLKPDLVAPGEKICGPIPLNGAADASSYKILDGTSMAAPHVSGVAALLMARNRELIGEPLRIKEILRATATDLGRMPTFQGAGLVDALRALQSV